MAWDPVKAREQVEAQQQKRMADMASTSETTASAKRVEDALEDLRRGFIGPIGNVTLTLSAASTTVTVYGISSNSWVGLMPTNAAARAEYAPSTTYATPAKGSMVITHPNNANTRTYRYVVFSGIRP